MRSASRAAAIAVSFAVLAGCGQDTQAAQEDANPGQDAAAESGEVTLAQTGEIGPPAPPPMTPAPPPATPAPDVSPDAAVMGDPDAPVEIIEYASVTCPHCAAFHADMFPHVKETWIDTGQARLVMRPLPTPPIELAVAGFLLADCSGPDHYFSVLSDLFETQEELFASASQADVVGYYEGIAAANGVDPDMLNACLTDEDAIDRLNASITAADADGVSGTPAFVINGTLVPGGQLQTTAGWDSAVQTALDEAE